MIASQSSLKAMPISRKVAVKANKVDGEDYSTSRRQVVFRSFDFLTVAALFSIGAVARPDNVGTGRLSLCPPTPNCVSSNEAKSDQKHYAPGLSYGSKTKAQAIDDVATVIAELSPDNFSPTLITKSDSYVYAEYQSPTFGFIDDIEFSFPSSGNIVQYRSASRIGESDGDANRKRVKAIREALEAKGWSSTGV